MSLIFSMLTFIHGFYFGTLIISYNVNSYLERKYIVNDKSISIPFFFIYKYIIEISSISSTCTFSRANCKTYASHRASCLNYASLGVVWDWLIILITHLICNFFKSVTFHISFLVFSSSRECVCLFRVYQASSMP